MSYRKHVATGEPDLRRLAEPVEAVIALTEALRVRHADLGPERLAQVSALLSRAADDLACAYAQMAAGLQPHLQLLDDSTKQPDR
jgi:hypothetical protein